MARKFRFLTADEIECRVAQCSDKGVQLLLYKTARTDAALLDEVYPDAWQNDFKVIDGKMYGGIGIKVNSEWLWRWDCGTESNMEAEKGEASDAFKRAGFKWGIGAELYSSPFIWVKAENCKIENRKCYDRFKVAGIDYDENGKINFLAIDNVSLHKAAFMFGDTRKKVQESAQEGVQEAPTSNVLRQQILVIAPKKGVEITKIVKADYKGKKWEDLNVDDLAAIKKGLLEREDV
jgi:hypothetical protein